MANLLGALCIGAVAPRGGPPGTQVTITGEAFNGIQGKVIFDPLGFALEATIVSWTPVSIVCTVPAGLATDRFVTVQVERYDQADTDTIPFWIPKDPPEEANQDYQYPDAEAGEDENDDDPRQSTAADFNRILARVRGVEFKLDQRADQKDSCQAATTADVGAVYDPVGGVSARGQLTNTPNTLDSVPLLAGMRLLVKDQADPTENGIYVVTTVGSGADGVWDRADDFDEDEEVTNGAVTFVTAGATHADEAWVVVSPDPVVIGGLAGDAIVWAIVGNPTTVQPFNGDKTRAVAAPTAGNDAATGLTLSAAPVSYCRVTVNGLGQRLGNGVKTLDCYFSDDGGLTAKGYGNLAAGDQLFWNGVTAGFNLLPSYNVDFEYSVVT